VDSSVLGILLPLALLAGAFWLLVLRPARARQQAALAVVQKVAPGARVMTTAGLFGTVTAVDGDEIDLEIAPGVVVRYMAAAVAKIVPDPAAEGTDGPSHPSGRADDTPDQAPD
jgi:preprotein translocase subunit YajC